MIGLLLEGFESALLPCSLVLLIPGVAVALAARQEAIWSLLGFGVAAIVGAWLRLSGRIDDPSTLFIALLFMASMILLVFPLVRRLSLIALVGGGLAGLGSAALWEPCVGENFGTLLTEVENRGPSGLALMAVYLVGVLSPLIVLGAVMEVTPWPAMAAARPFFLLGGGSTLMMIAVLVAANAHDDVISRLVAWSL